MLHRLASVALLHFFVCAAYGPMFDASFPAFLCSYFLIFFDCLAIAALALILSHCSSFADDL